MRHDIRITARVPTHHLQLDHRTIANWYTPRINSALHGLNMKGSVSWLDQGVISLALQYDANTDAGQAHHQAWLNAVLAALQNSGLNMVEAYVTRSIALTFLGGSAGAAGGYGVSRSPVGALVLGCLGLIVGSLVRAEVPIFQVSYSPVHGWYLTPVQQSQAFRVQFGLT